MLHELGHLVHAYITNDTMSLNIPYFKEMCDYLFGEGFEKMTTEEMKELFAHLFSVASVLDTEFEEANYLCRDIDREGLNRIKEFYERLLFEKPKNEKVGV